MTTDEFIAEAHRVIGAEVPVEKLQKVVTLLFAISIARERLASIRARKQELEKETPIADGAWQYSSGYVQGAREVVDALTKALFGDIP